MVNDMNEIERKYGKWLINNNNDIELVTFFHNNRNKFDKKDIYQYTLEELKQEAAKYISKRAESKSNKNEGSEKIYTDDQFTIIRIDTFEAMKLYGKHTRWCLTRASHYDEYDTASGGYLIYVILWHMNNKFLAQKTYKYCAIYDLNTSSNVKYYNEQDGLEKSLFSQEIDKIITDDANTIKHKRIYLKQKNILLDEFERLLVNKARIPPKILNIYKNYIATKCVKNGENIPETFLKLFNLYDINSYDLFQVKPFDTIAAKYVSKGGSTRYIRKLDIENKDILNVLLKNK